MSYSNAGIRCCRENDDHLQIASAWNVTALSSIAIYVVGSGSLTYQLAWRSNSNNTHYWVQCGEHRLQWPQTQCLGFGWTDQY